MIGTVLNFEILYLQGFSATLSSSSPPCTGMLEEIESRMKRERQRELGGGGGGCAGAVEEE